MARKDHQAWHCTVGQNTRPFWNIESFTFSWARQWVSQRTWWFLVVLDHSAVVRIRPDTSTSAQLKGNLVFFQRRPVPRPNPSSREIPAHQIQQQNGRKRGSMEQLGWSRVRRLPYHLRRQFLLLKWRSKFFLIRLEGVLDAFSHHWKRVRPSVRPSISPSVSHIWVEFMGWIWTK